MGNGDYHLPVSMNRWDRNWSINFEKSFPIFPNLSLHCNSGKRAGAMVMMHMAIEQGMTGDQTLQKAEEMGFECDQPELGTSSLSYVDSARQTK